MNFKSLLVAGATAFAVAHMPGGAALAANASSVQLAAKFDREGACPRHAALTLWAHMDGPGVVAFVLLRPDGGQTGQLQAEAVQGAAGTWLATYTHQFIIAADVDASYRAEVPSSGKMSNWVRVNAFCTPRAKPLGQGKGAGGASGPPATSTRSDARPVPTPPRPVKTEKPVRATTPKPLPSAPKPNSDGQCKGTVTAHREMALARKTGIATAWVGWRAGVKEKHGIAWSHLENAKDKADSCKRRGVFFTCTVSARPCIP